MNDLFSSGLNWADYFIIGVILISTLISLLRGFISEAISLVIWAVALFVAIKFATPLSNLFINLIKTPSLRFVVSFIVLFLVVLIIGSIFSHFVTVLVRSSGLSGTNRLIGMIFGFARGVLLIAILVLGAQFTSITKDPWWQKSRLIPYFLGIAAWLHQIIPIEASNLTHYLSQTKGHK